MSVESTFGEAIQRLERRAQALRQVSEIVAEFPDLVQDILLALGGGPQQARGNEASVGASMFRTLPEAVGQSAAGGTHYALVRRFFEMNGNRWTSAPDVARSIGVSRGAAAHVFWKTYTASFEKKEKPGSVKIKLWRLRPDLLGEGSGVITQSNDLGKESIQA